MTTLDKLDAKSQAHWNLHLNACRKDNTDGSQLLSLTNVSLVDDFRSGAADLPVGHPAVIHDWVEIPSKRGQLEQDYPPTALSVVDIRGGLGRG